MTKQLVFYGYSAASFTNKIDRHNITEILLKVALNTLTLTMYNLCDEEVTIFIKIINLL